MRHPDNVGRRLIESMKFREVKRYESESEADIKFGADRDAVDRDRRLQSRRSGTACAVS